MHRPRDVVHAQWPQRHKCLVIANLWEFIIHNY